MSEGKGKVSRIFQNETRGGKPYWVVAVQTGPGEYARISAFDYNTISGINEGDTISYKFEQKGKYSNLVEITKTEKTGGGGREMLDYRSGGDLSIGRMSAIKSAAQLLADYKGDPQEKINKTLSAAMEFEKYIFGAEEDGTKKPPE